MDDRAKDLSGYRLNQAEETLKVAGNCLRDGFYKDAINRSYYAAFYAVKKARANKEWRREYMTLMMRDLENQEIGIEKGKAEEQRDRIANMLKRGKTPEEIADFCNYPIEQVKQVEESLLVVP